MFYDWKMDTEERTTPIEFSSSANQRPSTPSVHACVPAVLLLGAIQLHWCRVVFLVPTDTQYTTPIQSPDLQVDPLLNSPRTRAGSSSFSRAWHKKRNPNQTFVCGVRMCDPQKRVPSFSLSPRASFTFYVIAQLREPSRLSC